VTLAGVDSPALGRLRDVAERHIGSRYGSRPFRFSQTAISAPIQPETSGNKAQIAKSPTTASTTTITGVAPKMNTPTFGLSLIVSLSHAGIYRCCHVRNPCQNDTNRGFALSRSDEVDHHRHYRYGDEDVSNPLVSC
jgi:hypothetical protein